MGADITPYVFPETQQAVRTVEIDGKPWFVARDVCAVLGVANAADAIGRIPERMKGVGNYDTPGGRQRMSVINLPGAIRLIMRSNKPWAERFQDWLAEDVVPSVMETGHYSTVETAPAIPDVSTPAGVLAMAEMFAKTAQQLVTTTAELEAAKPKAESFDALMSSEGHLNMNEVAKTLGVGRTRLYEFLRSERILIDNPGRKDQHNVPYQAYMRYFHVATKKLRNTYGRTFIVATTYVKPSGVEFIRKRLAAA